LSVITSIRSVACTRNDIDELIKSRESIPATVRTDGGNLNQESKQYNICMENIIDLSSNVNPLRPSEQVMCGPGSNGLIHPEKLGLRSMLGTLGGLDQVIASVPWAVSMIR
jgi:hypothetical protein